MLGAGGVMGQGLIWPEIDDFRSWKLANASPIQEYHCMTAVFFPFTLKDVLKRGALVAAANWTVALVQATADSLIKLLFQAPLICGVFLVALVVAAERSRFMSSEWRRLGA